MLSDAWCWLSRFGTHSAHDEVVSWWRRRPVVLSGQTLADAHATYATVGAKFEIVN